MVLTTPFEVEASKTGFVLMPGVGDHKYCPYLAPGAPIIGLNGLSLFFKPKAPLKLSWEFALI